VVDNLIGPEIFLWGAVLQGYRGQLKAGEYELAPGASMAEIARQMAEGRVLARSITVPEGLTVPQIVARLMAESSLTGEVTQLPPEGSLMPETYQFLRGDTRGSVIKRMQEAKTKLIAELWAKRAPGLPLKTPLEAVTLASIVEKETGVAPERGKVAGVFINRLRLGMKLQSDPTTIYAVTNGTGELGRELLFKDLRVEHPYNTYHVTGLPPGPIANPGQASLAAVLNPLPHDYLYFVADGTGGHAFAKTLAEHNRNVQNWRKIERAAEQN
jgi:UPF0755 protein